MEHSFDTKTEQADKKSYYAVIPAAVRYDAELSSGEKLLYGEITALCNEKGYCWASNKYFATLYNKHVDTITRWIKNLVKLKYIRSVIDRDAGNSRRLYLSAKVQVATCKNAGRLPAQVRVAASKNAGQNNIDNKKLKNKDNNDCSSESLLSNLADDNGDQLRAYNLLVYFGVSRHVAGPIVFEQHTPLGSIQQTLKNGLAKAVFTNGFILEAGYIVQTLNKARSEGKIVSPTKLCQRLENKLADEKVKHDWEPKTPKQFEKTQIRMKAALDSLINH